MKRIASREGGLLATAVLIAVFWLAYSTLLEPGAGQLVDFSKRAQQRAQELSHQLRLSEDAQQIQAEYAGLKTATEATNQLPGLLARIEEIARNFSMDVTELKPADILLVEGHREMSLEISVEATASRLMSFLHEVEGGPLLLRVEQLTIFGSDKEKLRCSMRLNKLFID